MTFETKSMEESPSLVLIGEGGREKAKRELLKCVLKCYFPNLFKAVLSFVGCLLLSGLQYFERATQTYGELPVFSAFSKPQQQKQGKKHCEETLKFQ